MALYRITDDSPAANAFYAYNMIQEQLIRTMQLRRKAKDKASHHTLTVRMKTISAKLTEARRMCRLIGVNPKASNG